MSSPSLPPEYPGTSISNPTHRASTSVADPNDRRPLAGLTPRTSQHVGAFHLPSLEPCSPPCPYPTGRRFPCRLRLSPEKRLRMVSLWGNDAARLPSHGSLPCLSSKTRRSQTMPCKAWSTALPQREPLQGASWETTCEMRRTSPPLGIPRRRLCRATTDRRHCCTGVRLFPKAFQEIRRPPSCPSPASFSCNMVFGQIVTPLCTHQEFPGTTHSTILANCSQ